ncbi:SIR2 family protein [Proteiniclasticum ruminis]|uniref:SIR2-like domain-containing protein n=1 Tax=Proteiniclasticum ruminis TaxID=398199 RepID=A0A1G8GJ09_9CLOT|nr:SIR2 family protein [Proteiniclasticum ruminis]SDH94300.1 SIR2-like domain-containing protein [Proteiniclasticum ruminis]
MENKLMIQEIPELINYPGIIRAAKEGTLVFFIGAGVSKLYGLPGWDQYARNELEQLFEGGLIDYQTMEKLLQSRDAKKILTLTRIIKNRTSTQKEFTSTSKDIFSVKSGKNSGLENKIYKELFDLDAIYITTNYDDCIDVFWHKRNQILNEVKDEISKSNSNEFEQINANGDLEGRIIFKKEDIIKSKLDTSNIIHLHGSYVDEATMLVTIPDYLNFYGVKGTQDNPGIADFLDTLFNSAYTVVFLGYGLEEFEILEYMLQKVVDSKVDQKHFMLYPTYPSEKKIIDYYYEYYKNFGIEIIPYDISEKGYIQLQDIISNWSSILTDLCKPKSNYVKIKELQKLIKEINEDSSKATHKVNTVIDYLESNKNLEVHFFLKEFVPKLFLDLETSGFFQYSTIGRVQNEAKCIIEYWPQSKYLFDLVAHESSTTDIKLKVIDIYMNIMSQMLMEPKDLIDYSVLNSLFEIVTYLKPNEITTDVLRQITMCLEKPTLISSNIFRKSKDVLKSLISEGNTLKIQEMIYIAFLLLEANFVFISSVQERYDSEFLLQLSGFIDKETLKRVIRHIEKFFEQNIVYSVIKNEDGVEELLVIVTRGKEGFQIETREFGSYDADSFFNKNFTRYKLKDKFTVKGLTRDEFVHQTSSIIKDYDIDWNQLYTSFYVQSAYQDILVILKDTNNLKIESLTLMRDLIHSTILSEVNYRIIHELLDVLYKSEYLVMKKVAVNLLTEFLVKHPSKSDDVLRLVDFEFVITSPYLNAEVKRLLNSIPTNVNDVILGNIITIIERYQSVDEEEKLVWRFKRLKELKHIPKVSKLIDESYSTLNPNYEMIPLLGEIEGFVVEEKSPISDEELSELSIDVIIDFTYEFKESGRWEQPSIAGLELALSRDVKNNPNKYFSSIDKLLKIDTNYYYKIISSLFDWDEKNNLKEAIVLLGNVNDYISLFLTGVLKNKDSNEMASVCRRVCEYIDKGIGDNKFDEEEVKKIAQLLLVLLEKSNDVELPRTDLEGITLTINSLQGSIIKSTIMFLDYTSKDKYNDLNIEERIFMYFNNYSIQKSVEFYVWFGVYSSYFKNRFLSFYRKVFSMIEKNSSEWINFLEGYLYSSRVNRNVYQDMIPHYIEGFSDIKLNTNSKRRIAEHLVIGYINDFDTSMSIEMLLNTLLKKEEYNNILLIINSISDFYSRSEEDRLSGISKTAQKVWNYIYRKCSSKGTEIEGLRRIAENSLKLMKCIGTLNSTNLSEVLFFIKHINSEYVIYDVYTWLYELFESNCSVENTKNIATVLLGMSKVINFTFDYDHPIKDFIESLLVHADENTKDIIQDIQNEFAKRNDTRLIDIKVN